MSATASKATTPTVVWEGTVLGIPLASITPEGSLQYATKSEETLSQFALCVASLMGRKAISRDELEKYYAVERKAGRIHGVPTSGGSLSTYALAGSWLMRIPAEKRDYAIMVKARRCAGTLNSEKRKAAGYVDNMSASRLYAWLTGKGLKAADASERNRADSNSTTGNGTRQTQGGAGNLTAVQKTQAAAEDALKTLKASDQRGIVSVVRKATTAPSTPVSTRLLAMIAPLESVRRDGVKAKGLPQAALNTAVQLADILSDITKLPPLSAPSAADKSKQEAASKAAASKRKAAGNPTDADKRKASKAPAGPSSAEQQVTALLTGTSV